MSRVDLRLRDLRNVGKATLADLHLLGIQTVAELARQEPTRLFHRLEEMTETRQDPCVWDVFSAIIHQAKSGESSDWWSWTPKRKHLQERGQFKHATVGRGARSEAASRKRN
jgi:hypothetical protein